MPFESRIFAEHYLTELKRVLNALSTADVARMLEAFLTAHREGRRVFVIGNGGSAATASHMVNDLVWGLTRAGVKPMAAYALTDNVALMTAIANDEGYACVFSRQLEALAAAGDVLVVISGSGNSQNVIAALELAARLGMKRVGILGMDGGRARSMVDVALVVPSNEYGPIEDVHMVLDHLTLAFLREALGAG